METYVYLVRHAHSEYTPDELGRPLSETGREYAQKAAALLLAEGADIVVSSPFKRAVETVEGATAGAGAAIILDEGFAERKLAEGFVEDFQEAVRKVWSDESFAWPGGESNLEARHRGVQALKRIIERFPGKRIAIGTHGNLMALIISHYDARYGWDFWRGLKMPDIYCLTFRGEDCIGIHRIWKD